MSVVLVVDDDADLRSILGDHLREALDCRILEADGAWSALRRLDEVRPALIISDLSMPMGTGIDLLHVLRDRKIDIPVVVFSACIAEVRQSLERNGVPVIEKPDIRALIREARKALRGMKLTI